MSYLRVSTKKVRADEGWLLLYLKCIGLSVVQTDSEDFREVVCHGTMIENLLFLNFLSSPVFPHILIGCFLL